MPIGDITSATSGGVAVAVDGVTKRFGGQVALDGISFSVPAGQVVGFVGPNGAGKTTTIRVLLGLAKPTSGSATVLGHPITHPERFLQHVGAFIDGPAFYPYLSGRDNLFQQAALRGVDDARVDDVLDEVGLTSHAAKRYSSYSHGMRQRLGLAAALLTNPRLLILDEPANGLDPVGIRELRSMLRRWADEGRTFFVSSHLLDELEQVCDHIVMLDRGRVVYDGTAHHLLSDHGSTVIAEAETDDGASALAMACVAAGGSVRRTGPELEVEGLDSAAVFRAAVAAGTVLVSLRRQSDLEDRFFALTTPLSAAS